MDTLYLVIPCYNEEEVLPETSKQLLAKMQSLMAAEKVSEKSRIVFVNDGSKDRTWEIIQALHQENPIYQGVCLSRNRGHQNALLGGLMTVKNHCDMAISLDADLQDDIDAIDEMVTSTMPEMTWSTACGMPGKRIPFSRSSPPRAFIRS